MMLEASNIPLPLDAGLPGQRGESAMRKAVARALRIAPDDVLSCRLLKRSVDARKKNNVHFVATLAVETASELSVNPVKGVNVKSHELREPLSVLSCAACDSGGKRVVVVGTGPAGLFAALYLARAGLHPLVVERGSCVERREAAVRAFAEGGALDVRTNIQFGEGGAGAFSDGKLTTGTKSPHIRHVLQAFVDAGAPEEILWQAKPHIGTDILPGVVRNLRKQIVEFGGEVRFDTQLVDIGIVDGLVESGTFETVDGNGETSVWSEPVCDIVLACGHSARDTFELLREKGVRMERKPFAVGVRIEHPQCVIDRAQYGSAANHEALGAADYKLAVHLPNGRGVYTFCMCPGGEVVAAASEEGRLVVNGMSRFARDGCNANSALLVGIEPSDFESDDVLAGVAFQRRMEEAAFACSAEKGLPYQAPAQRVGDFLRRKGESKPSKSVVPTYPRGVAWCDLHVCLPSFVADALCEGLPLLDRKLRGFAHPDAVMTGVETRSSSPVRIVRGEDFQAFVRVGKLQGPAENSRAEEDSDLQEQYAKLCGFYPCGEGAGYAGGIMSAAVDGLRVAHALCESMIAGS